MPVPVLINKDKQADAGRIRAAFAARGIEAVVREVPAAALAETARDAVARGAEAVVAAGGDGTVSTVAGALVGTEAALGVLPLGTFNHFAQDLGIPEHLDGAVEAFAAGRRRRIDIAEVNGRIFVNNSVLGVYPQVVEARRSRGSSRLRKSLGTVLTALRVAPHIAAVPLRIETGERYTTGRMPFVFVGTHAYEMRFFAFRAQPRQGDGHLHIYFLRCRSLGCLLQFLLLGFVKDLTRVPGVEVWRASELYIHTPDAEMQVFMDGEVTRLAAPLHYRHRPEALHVIAPAQPQRA